MTIHATRPPVENISLERIAQATGRSAAQIESIQSKGNLWSFILQQTEDARGIKNPTIRALCYYLRPVAISAGSKASSALKINEEISVPFTASEARQVRKLLRDLGYDYRCPEDIP